jgi:acetyltransferase-like isoleucine patch superfamily enzyme
VAEGDINETFMKALSEVGIKRLLWFAATSFAGWLIRITPTPPLRALALSLFGARIGGDSVILPIALINLDRAGLPGLTIGRECYLGHETLLDLAAPISIGDKVTFGPRVMALTHLNVGYADHPLQLRFPSKTLPVVIHEGAFIGAGAILLPGVTVGRCAFVAAGAVVVSDVMENTLVMGVPATVRR